MTTQGLQPRSTNTPPTAQQRHWMYGANVAVLVVVLLVLLVFVCYLTQRFTWRRDWTLGGVHSLSPRTRSLLQDVDKKGQSFELYSTFSPCTARREATRRRRNTRRKCGICWMNTRGFRATSSSTGRIRGMNWNQKLRVSIRGRPSLTRTRWGILRSSWTALDKFAQE